MCNLFHGFMAWVLPYQRFCKKKIHLDCKKNRYNRISNPRKQIVHYKSSFAKLANSERSPFSSAMCAYNLLPFKRSTK